MNRIIILAAICFSFAFAYETITYYRSAYYQSTHKSYIALRLNTGAYGEYLLYDRLKKQEKDGGRFLFNTYLKKEDNTTTEIDVILINRDGIFVFESKNYSGWIFGNSKQMNWTQCLPRGKGKTSSKEHFLNPIFQNRLHIKTLSAYIGSELPYYSIISFSERCTLKDIVCDDVSVSVIKRNQVNDTVRKFGERTKNTISKEKIETIYQTLYPHTQVADKIKEQHIAEIRSKLSDSISQKQETDKIKTIHEKETSFRDQCPICGGKLILRTGKRGRYQGKQFYGCSNYPKCRYIKNIGL